MNEMKPVAVVGLGAILPDAHDVPIFWERLKSGYHAVRPVPLGRWDPALYFDPDPSVPDKTYTKIGAWVQGFSFEPLKLGIPIPLSVLNAMDDAQKWAIAAARQALDHYGYPQRSLNPERVAVILGNALAGEYHYRTSLRIHLPEFLSALSEVEDFQNLPASVQQALLGGFSRKLQSAIPAITEDTMPGELSNIIAGRVSNVFNFAGPNFVTDAACASSLAALQSAVEGLNAYHFDAVLTGGVDRNMGVESFVKFSKIGALSPDGSRPYAAGANGFVMGEGAALFLLKRLEDAEKDGDTIYAVVRGIGSSSDGKGKGITAPNPAGQQRAILRAWQNAGLDPATIGMIEGHGTSTRVGDVVEVASLNDALGASNLPAQSVALGSVKSNIGHLKSAAGAAGLLKVVLSLHHRQIPPSVNFEQPNPQIPFHTTPFRVPTQLTDWENRGEHPRRAALSSFGFGGTNFHVVVDEYVPGVALSASRLYPGAALSAAEAAPTPVLTPAAAAAPAAEDAQVLQWVTALVAEKTGYPPEMLDSSLDLEADLGVDTVKQAELFAAVRSHYDIPRREDLRLSDYNTLEKVAAFVTSSRPSQPAAAPIPAPAAPVPSAQSAAQPAPSASLSQDLLFLSAPTVEALNAQVEHTAAAWAEGRPAQPAPAEPPQAHRLALIGDPASPAETAKRLEKAQKALQTSSAAGWAALATQGIFYAAHQPGKTAFLFPGQGSQYADMLRDLCPVEPVIQRTFEEADAVMTPILGRPLTDFIFTRPDEPDTSRAEQELRNTAITQPAVLTANVALLRLLQQYGFSPDWVIGHSLGEYAALVAAGVLTFAEALEVVSARGREMSKVAMADNGCMAAVSGPIGEVQRLLQQVPGYVVIANLNSPVQSVIAGETAAVEAAIALFQSANIQAVKIPVSHAFHSKIVAPASEPLRQVISRMQMQSPRIPVVANVTGQAYPAQPAAVLDLLAQQVAAPVQFIRGVQTLWNEGVRTFVEVGPKRVLTALLSDILKDRGGWLALSTNHPRKGGVLSFQEALCGLYAAGARP
ncbi:type I polyketide synthase, partial [Levilinea saccharolytica]